MYESRKRAEAALCEARNIRGDIVARQNIPKKDIICLLAAILYDEDYDTTDLAISMSVANAKEFYDSVMEKLDNE